MIRNAISNNSQTYACSVRECGDAGKTSAGRLLDPKCRTSARFFSLQFAIADDSTIALIISLLMALEPKRLIQERRKFHPGYNVSSAICILSLQCSTKALTNFKFSTKAHESPQNHTL